MLDTMAPRTCAICGSRLSGTEAAVCSSCCLHLPRTGFCHSYTDNRMEQLFRGQLAVERAAALIYHHPKSESARLIYGMKYAGRADAAVIMGKMMAHEFAGTGFFDGIDVMVPVPLTHGRQRSRGYNQSEMLAHGISEVTGIAVESRAMTRTDFARSQTSLTRRMRRDNVEDAFRLSRKGTEQLRQRHILIVDDVATSGSTTMACGTCMSGIDGVSISIATLAFTKS